MNRRQLLIASIATAGLSLPRSALAQTTFPQQFRALLNDPASVERMRYSLEFLRYGLAVAVTKSGAEAERALSETQPQFDELWSTLLSVVPKARDISQTITDDELSLPEQYARISDTAMLLLQEAGVARQSTIGENLAFSFESAMNIARLVEPGSVTSWFCDHFPFKYACR